MKKILNVCLKKLLPLVCTVFMLSGCLQIAGWVIGAALVGAMVQYGTLLIVGGIVDGLDQKITLNKRLNEFGKEHDNPFNSPAESRLTRRTSSLTGGTPVDISPFLLHENSFIVTENGIQPCRAVLDFTELSHDGSDNSYGLYEFDTALTFEADGQKRQMNAAVAISARSTSKAQKQVEKIMPQYAAQGLGLDPAKMKKIKVKFLTTRKGKTGFGFLPANVFIQDIEPGYFQFDAEVEYQKKDNTGVFGIKKKLKPEDFAVFSKVYRSDFTIAAAAAIDVQVVIWKEARKKGFKQTPLPVINFVKSVRMR
jgi:hypothetical protein